MKLAKFSVSSLRAAVTLSVFGSLMLAGGQASAHVVYGNKLSDVGNQNNYVSSNAGWLG